MIKNGEYRAWFKTARGQGTGKVLLENGVISGGDTVISYGGTYHVDGSRFTATLTTRRHTDGQASVFGMDEVEIKLAGTAVSTFASCSGEVEQVPGMLFEVILMPVKDDSNRSERSITPNEFGPLRLTKPGAR